ncbi:hypothetical protein [Psychroserpens sp. Hel_I_66]|uniref:hypothetical protein n=1 Tax=Psychroserpens sp. Hel_I_66 TaxID=1250004 RepID=UPI000647F36E|nr:hypothetical protein [Psychroserpens sp. Hel_I_66]
MKKTFKFISKVIFGILIWLILVDIQWTFFDSHSIENLIFIVFGIFLLLLIISGIYWVFKKKRILKFAGFGTLYFLAFSITMILTNVVYGKIAESQFIVLLKDIEKYKIEKGQIPKVLSDLPTEHYNVYGIVPHEFIYEGYKPFIWNGIGFDESEIDSETEKIVGYKTPMGYTKYRIADDENIDDVIENVIKNVW